MFVLPPNSNTSRLYQCQRQSHLFSFDTDKETRLWIDLPGVKPDAIKVCLEKAQQLQTIDHFVSIRCPSKNVHEAFPLDERKYKIEKTTTQLVDDVLTVTIPKFPSRVIAIDNTSVSSNDDSSNTVLVLLNMPGMKPDDVSVMVQEGCRLVVSGTRRPLENAITKDSSTGTTTSFQRSFALIRGVHASTGTLRASLADGVLVIRTESSTAATAVVQTSVVPISTFALEQTTDDANGMFHFSADLPGVNAKDAKIEVVRKDHHHSVLSITAKGLQHHGRNNNNNTNQQHYASLRKEIALDHDRVDCGKLQASLVDGVLTITAPLMPFPEPQVLEIQYTTAGTNEIEDAMRELDVDDDVVTPLSHQSLTDEWEDI